MQTNKLNAAHRAHARTPVANGAIRRPKQTRCLSSSNGNGATKVDGSCPTSAQTARTVLDIASEGTLSTLTKAGAPLGSPVAFTLDKDGQPIIQLQPQSLSHVTLQAQSRCSLLVQPQSFPARALAAVALVGTAEPAESEATTSTSYKLHVDECIYYGGLDQQTNSQTISGDELRSAEPDILRHAATDLIHTWNSTRAEDIYRIVSDFLSVPLTEMLYAELLWLDQLGMYIRSEVMGRAPEVVRVPFYRPVIDERDARSVITMAAQLAWERERKYAPPVPSIFEEAAAAAAAQN